MRNNVLKKAQIREKVKIRNLSFSLMPFQHPIDPKFGIDK